MGNFSTGLDGSVRASVKSFKCLSCRIKEQLLDNLHWSIIVYIGACAPES